MLFEPTIRPEEGDQYDNNRKLTEMGSVYIKHGVPEH
jgi:hypothetical protein